MSKKISGFILSLALVFCAFFGLSACKGPLDDLTVKINAQRLTEVEGGYETTLSLGTEESTLTISASVENVGDNISKDIVWSCSDKSKVSVDVNAKNTQVATIRGLAVTQQGYPVKLEVSSIEKTQAKVVLWVNVVAEATNVTIRDNIGVAVKGSVYSPNILDYFTFTNDDGSENVTTPNYDYVLTVSFEDGTSRKLNYNEAIPVDAVSMTISFEPSDDNVFDSAIYTTQKLTVPSSQIVLYEPLDEIDYKLKLDDGDGDRTNDLEVDLIEMVLNKDNGQGQKYYIDGVNSDTMSVTYKVSPSTFTNYLTIEQNVNNPGEFYFTGQDETGANSVFVEFGITYNDPSIVSSGVFRVPFRVASYPDTISINSDRGSEAYELTVYNNYTTAGEALSVSLSPYSSLYNTLRISLISDDGTVPANADNLEWYIGSGATPRYIDSINGVLVTSGTRILLKNGLDANHEYGSGQIRYLISLEGATTINALSRELVVTLAYGINDITITENTNALHTDGKMYLAMDEDSSTRDISLTVWPKNTDSTNLNGANPMDIVDSSRYVIAPSGIVEIVNSVFSGSSEAIFTLKPLKVGAATITWTAPTGVSISVDVVVFSKFNEYSIGARGQSAYIGSITYETEKDENDLDQNRLDANNQAIIKTIKIATGSTIELNNILGPSNALIADVRYNVADRNIVTSVTNISTSFNTATLVTDKRGSTMVNCVVEYFDVESGNLVTKTKTYSFEVQTYNKVLDLTLTDPSITLYAKEDSAGRVYNTNLTTRQVNIITTANGMIDAMEDDAEWKIISSSSNSNPLTIKGGVVREDGESGVYYGSYITVTANSINLKEDRIITTIEVKLKDYNTILTTRLTVTVMPFETVKNATFDTTSLSGFEVVQNTQTADKKINRVISLYTEVDNAATAYFALRPNVTPVRAANKNLEYIVFDEENGALVTKTTGAHLSNMLSIVTIDGIDRIVINYDATTESYRVGNAVVYVFAQDALKKYTSNIVSESDIAEVQDAILMKFEITVADGNESAYRIYSAKDFYKIYAQKDKNFVLMKDLDGVDISNVIVENIDVSHNTTYTLDTSFAGTLTSFDDNIRTVTFAAINIVMNSDGQTLWNGVPINKESTSVFNELTGTIENINFVIPSYTYTTQSATSAIHSDIGLFVKSLGKDGSQDIGTLKNVNLTIKAATINNNVNNHASSDVFVATIAKVKCGVVQDFTVLAPSFVANLYGRSFVSLGIAKIENNVNNNVLAVAVKGNATISGNTDAQNIIFGGVVAQNNQTVINSTDYRVKYLQSMVNLNAIIPVSVAGGVVGQNNAGIYDARYVVINDSEAIFNGLNLTSTNSAGGVVGQNSNTGVIEYAYAISFVPNKGITLNNANTGDVDTTTMLGGVIGSAISSADAKINYVYSNLTITSNNQVNKTNGVIGSGIIAQVKDYYSNSTYKYAETTQSLSALSQDTVAVWSTNDLYTGGYYQNNTYQYLLIAKREVVDGTYTDSTTQTEAFLPMVPTDLFVEVSPYLVLEYIGQTTNNNVVSKNYNKIPVVISGGVATADNTTQMTTTDNTLKLFGTNGLFDITFPPLSSLSDLLINVTNTNTTVARVVPSVYANGYLVVIVGVGTTVINIASALNPDANVSVQICVVDGYDKIVLSSTNTDDVYDAGDTIALKLNNPEQFSVDYLDVANNNLSAGALQANFALQPGAVTLTSSGVALDSFVLKSTSVANDVALTVQKQIIAQFYDGDDLQNVFVKPTGHSWTYNVSTMAGPSAILLSQGDVDIYAGDHVYLNVDITCDDSFVNDGLYIYVDNQPYALITNAGIATYYFDENYYTAEDYENAVGVLPFIVIDVIGNPLASNNIKTFNLEYYLSAPADVLSVEEYGVEFEARPQSATTRGNVVASYNLHLEPQIITAVDMYHYIDVDYSDGELRSAGEMPSASIVAGGYGILKLTIDPYYVNYDRIEITSSVVDGYGVVFDQRDYVEDAKGGKYVVKSGTDITILTNGIITHKTTDQNHTGILFFRTYMPQNVSTSATFNIYANIYDKDNNLLYTKTNQYSIYASSAMSLTFDNFDATNNIAYIAQGTGGKDRDDIYGQNTNILNAYVQKGLLNAKIEITENTAGATLTAVDGNATMNATSSDVTKQYYITVPQNAELGSSFIVKLSAQTDISGVLTTISREMEFRVVDIVINLKWANPEQSQVLSLALNGDTGIAAIGGAISNVVDGNWTFSYTAEPIQITLFVSDVRSNKGLLDIDTTQDFELTEAIKTMLRNVPEFSFNMTAENVKKVIEILKSINLISYDNNTIDNTKTNIVFGYYDRITQNYISVENDATIEGSVNWIFDGTDEIKVHKIKALSVDAGPRLWANYYALYSSNVLSLSTSSQTGAVEYTYRFGLNYEENTSKDHPLPIRTLDDLKAMEAGKDYILLNDIDLNGAEHDQEFDPITTAISSFDGNNYKLIISKAVNPFVKNTANNMGVFAQVNQGTILKNIIVEVQNDITISCVDDTTSSNYNIGLLAAQNSGIITNCEVVSTTTQAGDTSGALINKKLTIVSDRQHNSNVILGGLVAVNQGYVTNSRVNNLDFDMTFATFGGLISQNMGMVSGCYVNYSNINNVVVAGDENSNYLAGFVAANSGTICESYVGGLNVSDEVTLAIARDTKRNVVISSNSAFGAFVHNNTGNISDCFATIDVKNAQTVRASGFVFENNGAITRCYSASRPSVNSNIYNRPFVGTTSGTSGEVALNNGTIVDSCYLADIYNQHQIGAEVATALTLDGMTNQDKQAQQWPNYSFASSLVSENGVWNPVSKTTLGPTLISANILGIAKNVHQKIDRIETTTGNSALYWYTLFNEANSSQKPQYNTKDCVALIYDATTFNAMFESDNDAYISADNAQYYARIICPIDLSVLYANNIEFNTTTKILRGTIMGNGMTISGVDIGYYGTSTTQADAGKFETLIARENATEKPAESDVALGLFGEICGGTFADVDVVVNGVYAETYSRLFVGGLAGRMLDGTLYNINLTGNNATILGRHIVGGIVGAVYGKSRISNISSNISVTSAYTSLNNEMAHIYNFDMSRMNNGGILENDYNRLSIAGGLFGVLDLFNYEATQSSTKFTTKIQENDTTNYVSTNLTFNGNNIIIGQVVGGVSGVVGCNTVVNNAQTIVGTNMHLRGSIYAGGLVGQNDGIIKYSYVEYTKAVQQAVNQANTGAVVESANAKVFDAQGYVSAVGGLVGANFGQSYPTDGQSGVIRYCSSAIYVDSTTAQNVGGLVGIVYGGDVRAVFATGYVVGSTNANVGGLIGTLASINSIDNNLLTRTNISPQAKIPSSLLIKVENPICNITSEVNGENVNSQVSIYPQTILLDFVVGQNNWASSYFEYYQNLKTYGHFGGLIGFTTDSSLLTTSHNGENYNAEGYTEDMTVAINYYNKYIIRNEVAPNTTINTENNSNILSIPAYDDGLGAEQLEQRTQYVAIGDTRNNAYSQTKWDWFALWDEYSIAGRNEDDTPIIMQGVMNIQGNISRTQDFIKMYWHPEADYYLTNNIYFNQDGKQIKYIMVGTSNLPFSGTFDGRGYTIESLSVSNYLSNIGGLFGYVAGRVYEDETISYATIKNVTIDGLMVNNVQYVGANRIVNNKYTTSMGGLAGTAEYANIENVIIQNLQLDFIAQNTNQDIDRYVGGFVGNASKDVNILNCGVSGLNIEKPAGTSFYGMRILQTNTPTTATEGFDNLYVGGLIGAANNTTINDKKFLMTVSNVDIEMQDVYSNTYFGAGIGFAQDTIANALIISGENSITGNMNGYAKLIVGGYYAMVSGTNNKLYSSYAYSTIKLFGLTGATTQNTTIAYDFVLDELQEVATKISVEAQNIIQNPLAETIKTQEELIEDHSVFIEKRSYNATSIINNLGLQSNLDMLKYYNKQTEDGDELEYYIPLDPFYSLTTKDDNYSTDTNDLTIAPEFYGNLVVFSLTTTQNVSTYQNTFGYVHATTKAGAGDDNTISYEAQEKALLKNVFNKIAKLYLTTNDGFGVVRYGAAKVITNNATNIQPTAGEYYILINDIRLTGTGTQYIFEELTGFINGHNHIIKLYDAGTLVHEIEGVVSGVQVQISGTAHNAQIAANTSRGILADILASSGCLYASGTSIIIDGANQNVRVGTCIISLAQGASFGGVVGESAGVVNDCWSHISYELSMEPNTNFGGIVGKATGGILANLNYYAEQVIGHLQNDTAAGILGTATAPTDMYMVLSFIFGYAGSYHVAKVNENINYITITQEDENGNIVIPTAKYFTLSNEGDGEFGIGKFIDFATVFKNIDVRNNEYYHTQFTQYYGLWDEEQGGINYGLVRLKVEPQVQSQSGANELDPIEVPNENIFAGMLEYEKSKAGRFYKLTKEDDGGVYDLALIMQNMIDLGYTAEGTTIANMTTVNDGAEFYGHIMGNGKTLCWSSGTPVPLFETIAYISTGYYSGTSIHPYIKNLIICYDNVNAIMNIVANTNKSTITNVEYIVNQTVTITSPTNYVKGGLVGINEGTISSTIIDGLNIVLTGTATGDEVFVGVVAGKQTNGERSAISNINVTNCSIVTNNFTDSATTMYVGGAVGFNESGQIRTNSNSQNNFISATDSTLLYFTQDTYLYYYDSVQAYWYEGVSTVDEYPEQTKFVVKNTAQKYKAGTFLRFGGKAQVLPLSGGEYQQYTILKNYMLEFDSECQALILESHVIKNVARSSMATGTYMIGAGMIITQGQYKLYEFFDFDEYQDGSILVAEDATLTYLTETAVGSGIYVANNVATYDSSTPLYKYYEYGTTDKIIVTSGTATLFETGHIEQSYVDVQLKNKDANITIYYAYENGGTYTTISKSIGNHSWGAQDHGYNTGHKSIWLAVDTNDGFITNSSLGSSQYGNLYYGSARHIITVAQDVSSTHIGDNTAAATGGVISATINTPDLNYVGGVAGYNSGIISYVFVMPQITANQYVGGVTGFNNGTISGVVVDGSYVVKIHIPASASTTITCGNNTEIYSQLTNNTDVDVYLDSTKEYYIKGQFEYNGTPYNNANPILFNFNQGTLNGDSYIGGIAGQNSMQITGSTVINTTIIATNDDAFVGGIAGSNQNGKWNSAQIYGGIVKDSFVGTSNNPNKNHTAVITGYNNGEIIISSTKISNTQLYVASAAYSQNNTETTHYVGLVTAENYGTISFNNALNIDKNSSINFALDSGYSSYTGAYTLGVGGVVGTNHGTIDRAQISASMLSNITIKNLRSQDILYLGGIAAINNNGARLTLSNIRLDFGNTVATTTTEEINGETVSITSTVTEDGTDLYFGSCTNNYVGGVAGINLGYIAGSTSFSYSSYHNIISSRISLNKGNALGGVVGINETSGVVYNVCYQGNLNGQYDNNVISSVGGIAGTNNGILVNTTYYSSNLFGCNNVGGIAGTNNTSGVVAGAVLRGIVKGQNNVGGFVGTNYGTVTNSSQYNNTGSITTPQSQGMQMVMDNATINTNSGSNFISFETRGTQIQNLTNGSFNYNIPLSTIFNNQPLPAAYALIDDNVNETYGGALTIKFLSDAVIEKGNGATFNNDGIDVYKNGAQEIYYVPAGKTMSCTSGAVITYKTNTYLVYYNTTQNPIAVTYSGTGNVCVNSNGGFASDGAVVDGYVYDSNNNSTFNLTDGQIFSWNTNATAKTTINAATTTFGANSEITYNSNTSVVLRNDTNSPATISQTYTQDTQSTIDGSVTHSASTTVTMGSANNFVQETLPSGTQMTYKSGTTLKIVVPYDVQTANSDNDVYIDGELKNVVTNNTDYTIRTYLKRNGELLDAYEYYVVNGNTETQLIKEGVKSGTINTTKWTPVNDSSSSFVGDLVYDVVAPSITILASNDNQAKIKFGGNRDTLVTQHDIAVAEEGETKYYTYTNEISTQTSTTPPSLWFGRNATEQTYTSNATESYKYTKVHQAVYEQDGNHANDQDYSGNTPIAEQTYYYYQIILYFESNTTIQFNQDTKVLVQGEQTYVSNTTSTFATNADATGAITHAANTSVTFNIDQQSSVTETYSNGATINYAQATTVDLPQNREYTLKGTQTLAEQSAIVVYGTYSGTSGNVTLTAGTNPATATFAQDTVFDTNGGSVVLKFTTAVTDYTAPTVQNSTGITVHGCSSVGGVVGSNQQGIISNINVSNVTIYTHGGTYVGGVVGYAKGEATTRDHGIATIYGCNVDGVSINKETNSSDRNYGTIVGGFAGYLNTIYVVDCYVYGQVSINAGYTIGGFVGQVGYGHNTHNVNIGDVTIINNNDYGTMVIIQDCGLGGKNMQTVTGSVISHTDNPNSMTGGNVGTAVTDPTSIFYNEGGFGETIVSVLTGKESQSADQRNTAQIIGHDPIDGSYTKSNISSDGNNLNNPSFVVKITDNFGLIISEMKVKPFENAIYGKINTADSGCIALNGAHFGTYDSSNNTYTVLGVDNSVIATITTQDIDGEPYIYIADLDNNIIPSMIGLQNSNFVYYGSLTVTVVGEG